MAEVLAEHAFHMITPVDLDEVNGPWQVECNCTADPIQGPGFLEAEAAFADHQANALAAEGYGLVTGEKRLMQLAALMAYDAIEEGAVRTARAEALEEAANDFGVNLTAMTGPRIRHWLMARAVAERGES